VGSTITRLKQPPGLITVVLTEMWERFSFYGMRALLVIYLTTHFGFDDRFALDVYGTYFGLLYLMPVIGGAVANRWVGFRMSLVLGGLLMTVGQFLLAYEGTPATVENGIVTRDDVALQSFFFGLACIATGNGFFKPSVSVLLGALYSENDPRRDGGFTWFIIGVNVGAILAAAVCGYLGQTYGWAYGFGAAGAGMLLGLAIFIFTPAALLPEPPRATTPRNASFLIVAPPLTLVSWLMMQQHAAVGSVLIALFIGITGLVFFESLREEYQAHKRKLWGLLLLTITALFFWALFDQNSSSINLLASRYVDLDLLGMSFKSSQLLGLSPFFVLLIGPLASVLWTKLGSEGRDPGPLYKFGLGFLALALCFGTLAAGIIMTPADMKLAVWWIVAAYVAHAVADLCIGPIGLATVSRFSPPNLVGLMMGYWFLGISIGLYGSGAIARFAASSASDAGHLGAYSALYSWLAVSSVAIALILAIASRFLKKTLPELSGINEARATPGPPASPAAHR
jgi:POT family proton-dependent oligopeptide transporter